MERVNSEMIRNISADYYLTALVAYLDMHDNKLTYCNAGHTYPVIFKRKERDARAAVLDRRVRRGIGQRIL